MQLCYNTTTIGVVKYLFRVGSPKESIHDDVKFFAASREVRLDVVLLEGANRDVVAVDVQAFKGWVEVNSLKDASTYILSQIIFGKTNRLQSRIVL